MTTVVNLLDDLKRRGVKIEARGDRLLLDAPKGAVSPSLIAQLRARKPELLDALRQHRRTFADSQNSHNSSQTVPEGHSANSANLRMGGAPLKTLRARIAAARDWNDLSAVVDAAQIAFVAGTLSGPQVELLAQECIDRAREIPEHADR